MNQDLIKYLPGLEEDLPEAFEKLAEIFQHQVFELCADGKKEGSPDFYIPYMMNDAVESYLVLKKCRLVGEYDEGGCSEVSGELIREEGKFALIVRQDGGNVFTLWFDTLEFVREYYQYHQIGHFWMKGQEQWRQMVYIVGTIYDKMEYLGKESCNRQEKEILPLIGFAPFRRWSPISDSLEDVYPPTPEGTECMKRLAAEAGDNGYVRMIKIYEKLPFRWMEKILARRLCSPKRESLYRLICNKTAKASGRYQKRHYEDCLEKKIRKKRQEVKAYFEGRGYEGCYPEYTKGNRWVQVTEEHPFTIMESENFQFRIQCMISEIKGKRPTRNAGFFKGRKRRGWILKL